MSLTVLTLLACTAANPFDTAGGDTAPPEEEPEWSYSGETGPEHWGELSEEWATCAEGTAQSPIDLVPADIGGGTGAPPTITWGSTGLHAYNPGHYVRYDVDDGSTLSWQGATYDLLQFHFHALSEHTVNGEHLDVEIHFVHARRDDDTKLAVIAMLAEVSGPPDELGVFTEGGALKFTDALALPVSEETTDLGTADLGAAFASVTGANAVHYTGSLTTPPCTEGVEFFILDAPVPMGADAIAAFQAVYDFNYRPVQPLNGRTVSVLSTGG